MTRPAPLYREVLATLVAQRRPLLVYHLFFSILAAAILVPAATWPLSAVGRLGGNAAVSTGDLLAFVLSPLGLLWLLTAFTLTALIAVVQQAGLILTAAKPPCAQYRSTLAGLWLVLRRAPALAVLTLLQVAAHALLAAPFLVIVVTAFAWLLTGYNGYFPGSADSADLWAFGIIAAISTAGGLAAQGALYVRWILAIPMVALGRHRPLSAIRESARRTRGRRSGIALAVLGMLAGIIVLPTLFTVAADAAGALLMAVLPENTSLMIAAMAIYLTLFMALTIAVTFVGTAVNAVLLYVLHQRLTAEPPRVPAVTGPPARCGTILWGAEAFLLAFAALQTALALSSLTLGDTATITAHRGSSQKAPENTLSAIEQAIIDGADYIEVDVRQTADGILVLHHDASLQRMTGSERHIWEVDYAELMTMDAGSRFAPEFLGARVPTLAEALAQVRGRARLYLDIKPSRHTPGLVRDVVALLRDQGMLEHTLLGSMSLAVVNEVKRLAPEARTTLFAQFTVGPLDRGRFDALALRANRITPFQVALARRNGHALHAWTVNRRADMSRLMDMGVDNIITDRPHELAALREKRSQLSDPERALLRMRSWLRHPSRPAIAARGFRMELRVPGIVF